ncbi:transporter [Prevotella sp. PCHR]|uniref:Transporter n=1 Tax=Xylanibacter caecicola TaxID=2736294 RepID=A0ABX2B326_9BACT|nr:transporter [Xylanibacter caecicola]NPE25120.1 transporter [Xylanibacter caecicola]
MNIIRFIKNWTLPLAMIAGVVSYFAYVRLPFFAPTRPYANAVVGVVQPLLIFSMLFLTFCKISFDELHLRRWHLWHILIQTGLFAILSCILMIFPYLHCRVLIESAMLCLLCPTATAAAVVTAKLDGSAASITAYTIIINLAVAVIAPLLLPLAHPHEGLTFLPTFTMILHKVFPMLICPLIAAWAVRRWCPKLLNVVLKVKDLSFYLWAVALAIAIAVTVKAIVHSTVPVEYEIAIAAVSLACCLFQFAAGKRIGSAYGERTEGGQALGQKNTVFIIWMGYTFLSPVTAVAGGFYSVWHNIINSWQLYKKRERRERKEIKGDKGRYS